MYNELLLNFDLPFKYSNLILLWSLGCILDFYIKPSVHRTIHVQNYVYKKY